MPRRKWRGIADASPPLCVRARPRRCGGVQPAGSARPELIVARVAADPAVVEVVAAIERDRIALAITEHHVTAVVLAHVVVAAHVDAVAVLAIEVIDVVVTAGIVAEVEIIAWWPP